MKKFLCILLATLTALTLFACAPASSGTSSGTDSSYYPLTVTDQAGREVTLQGEPQRIISAYYISGSLLIALGLEDRIVGIENKADKRAIYALGAPELQSLPQIGTAKELDIEGCTALNPDLMILPMKLKSVVPTLENLGLTVLLVDPEDQQRLNAMVKLIGAATNRAQAADELLNFIAQQEKFLTDTLADEAAPSVYLAGNSDLLKTAGNAMYQSDMIRLAGGTNAAAAITDTYWAQIDYEQLLTWDPEYIILAADATYTVEDVLTNPNLAACRAVKNGNVYAVPNRAEAWDSPVPASILGAVWLGNILHPDKIGDAECAARIDGFYETFYGFTYSEN